MYEVKRSRARSFWAGSQSPLRSIANPDALAGAGLLFPHAERNLSLPLRSVGGGGAHVFRLEMCNWLAPRPP